MLNISWAPTAIIENPIKYYVPILVRYCIPLWFPFTSHANLCWPAHSAIALMEIEIDSESNITLLTDSHLRLYYRQKFSLETRLPQDVKTWADELVTSVHITFPKGQEPSQKPLNKKLLMIRLRRGQIMLCFEKILIASSQPVVRTKYLLFTRLSEPARSMVHNETDH
jgi:hypothetical protein